MTMIGIVNIHIMEC